MQVNERVLVVIEIEVRAQQIAGPQRFLLHKGLVEIETLRIEWRVDGCHRPLAVAQRPEGAQLIELHLPHAGLALFGQRQGVETDTGDFQKYQQIVVRLFDKAAMNESLPQARRQLPIACLQSIAQVGKQRCLATGVGRHQDKQVQPAAIEQSLKSLLKAPAERLRRRKQTGVG